MKIGIIAAMPEELAYLIQHLENAQEETVLGNSYHTGSIGSVELVLVESGIGKVMSAMSVAILADHFKVDAVINTGSAGALAEGIEVGDVVIADKLAYHDVDVTAFGYEYGQMAQQPLYFESDKKFVSLIQESLSKLKQKGHLGLISTGDSFIAGEDKIKAIKEHFPQVLAVEMEGAAIAQIARKNGVPFLILRFISDEANTKAPMTYTEFERKAIAQSVDFVLEFLK